ncbi:cadherin-like domain-containing protein [Myxococcus stipitatus]|uniref:cadherin-like domain-containing protein n=1 Tax=Myxococcus stipitatus TaxID=83455 RepID=UPI003CC84848
MGASLSEGLGEAAIVASFFHLGPRHSASGSRFLPDLRGSVVLLAVALAACGGEKKPHPGPANATPSAVDDLATTREDSNAVIQDTSLVSNDVDADGDALKVISIDSATGRTRETTRGRWERPSPSSTRRTARRPSHTQSRAPRRPVESDAPSTSRKVCRASFVETPHSRRRCRANEVRQEAHHRLLDETVGRWLKLSSGDAPSRPHRGSISVFARRLAAKLRCPHSGRETCSRAGLLGVDA